MVVLMSALPGKQTRTKGCCFASSFRRRADTEHGMNAVAYVIE
jgi:hypothetical protein